MALQAVLSQQKRSTNSPTLDLEMSHHVKHFSMENSILKAEHDVLQEIFENSTYGKNGDGCDNFAQKRFAIRVKAAKISGMAEGKLMALRQELNLKVIKRALRRISIQKQNSCLYHHTSCSNRHEKDHEEDEEELVEEDSHKEQFDEEKVDEKLEAEEEEAIFQLALCSLWTNQKKLAEKHLEIKQLGYKDYNDDDHNKLANLSLALSDEKARCRVLIAERDEATQSVARSEEAMQRLLKGISSMKGFFAQKIKALEETNNQLQAELQKNDDSDSDDDDDDDDGDSDEYGYDVSHFKKLLKKEKKKTAQLEQQLGVAKLEILEREEESEELSHELQEIGEKLNDCYATISKLKRCGFSSDGASLSPSSNSSMKPSQPPHIPQGRPSLVGPPPPPPSRPPPQLPPSPLPKASSHLHHHHDSHTNVKQEAVFPSSANANATSLPKPPLRPPPTKPPSRPPPKPPGSCEPNRQERDEEEREEKHSGFVNGGKEGECEHRTDLLIEDQDLSNLDVNLMQSSSSAYALEHQSPRFQIEDQKMEDQRFELRKRVVQYETKETQTIENIILTSSLKSARIDFEEELGNGLKKKKSVRFSDDDDQKSNNDDEQYQQSSGALSSYVQELAVMKKELKSNQKELETLKQDLKTTKMELEIANNKYKDLVKLNRKKENTMNGQRNNNKRSLLRRNSSDKMSVSTEEEGEVGSKEEEKDDSIVDIDTALESDEMRLRIDFKTLKEELKSKSTELEEVKQKLAAEIEAKEKQYEASRAEIGATKFRLQATLKMLEKAKSKPLESPSISNASNGSDLTQEIDLLHLKLSESMKKETELNHELNETNLKLKFLTKELENTKKKYETLRHQEKVNVLSQVQTNQFEHMKQELLETNKQLESAIQELHTSKEELEEKNDLLDEVAELKTLLASTKEKYQQEISSVRAELQETSEHLDATLVDFKKAKNESGSDKSSKKRGFEFTGPDAVANTMAYLKGHLVQLRPDQKQFIAKAISKCAAGFELRLFREAHLTIKRAIVEVAGEQSRYVRRWLIPQGCLDHINSHRQHELLKQIRLLVVAYDNMDEASKEKLTTAAEVLANLDVLIEVGQVCLAAEHARRQQSPRALRPTEYGAHDIPVIVDGSLVPYTHSLNYPPPPPHILHAWHSSLHHQIPENSAMYLIPPPYHHHPSQQQQQHYQQASNFSDDNSESSGHSSSQFSSQCRQRGAPPTNKNHYPKPTSNRYCIDEDILSEVDNEEEDRDEKENDEKVMEDAVGVDDGVYEDENNDHHNNNPHQTTPPRSLSTSSVNESTTTSSPSSSPHLSTMAKSASGQRSISTDNVNAPSSSAKWNTTQHSPARRHSSNNINHVNHCPSVHGSAESSNIHGLPHPMKSSSRRIWYPGFRGQFTPPRRHSEASVLDRQSYGENGSIGLSMKERKELFNLERKQALRGRQNAKFSASSSPTKRPLTISDLKGILPSYLTKK